MPEISFVVPMLNEADQIRGCLGRLQAWRALGDEVIVADGGSDDASVAIATPLCDALTVSAPGRALQMNQGAARASGNMIAFLHADTHIGAGAREEILAARDTWTFFDVRFDDERWPFQVIAWFMNTRSRISKVATGDQVICVSRALFLAAGGYPDIPIMEDVALSKKLRRDSQPRWSAAQVRTSARRWRCKGLVRTIVLMWVLRFAFFAGVSPERLVRFYR
ncbi:MAG: TIGR04283 family arsenosugar biosynthesis glycosyltransferase [Pseudomonadota bacterium]